MTLQTKTSATLTEMLRDYLKSKGGNIICTDEGWITYTQPHPDYLRIDDIYVLPEWRKCALAAHLANQVFEIAKDRKCKYVEGYIEQEYKHKSAYLLYYGFEQSDECTRWVYFRKDVK